MATQERVTLHSQDFCDLVREIYDEHLPVKLMGFPVVDRKTGSVKLSLKMDIDYISKRLKKKMVDASRGEVIWALNRLLGEVYQDQTRGIKSIEESLRITYWLNKTYESFLSDNGDGQFILRLGIHNFVP